MAGLGDLFNKGKDALKDERTSDKILDGLHTAADKITGNKYDAQTDKLREQADKYVGDENHTGTDKRVGH